MMLWRVVRLMNKEEIKNAIEEMFKNLNTEKVESISIDNGIYSDGAGYTQINIDYFKGGEDE